MNNLLHIVETLSFHEISRLHVRHASIFQAEGHRSTLWKQSATHACVYPLRTDVLLFQGFAAFAHLVFVVLRPSVMAVLSCATTFLGP